MHEVSPEKFIAEQGLRIDCLDHHFTGPSQNQQAPNNGSVFHNEGQILFGLAHKLYCPILEIGAMNGISTRYLHEGLFKRGSSSAPLLYSVDIRHQWPEDPDWPLRVRVERSSWGYKCPAVVGLAYIDGDHTYKGVRADIRTALRCGAPRILLHDCSPVFDGVPVGEGYGCEARPAALHALDKNKWDLTYISTQCGLIYAELLPRPRPPLDRHPAD